VTDGAQRHSAGAAASARIWSRGPGVLQRMEERKEKEDKKKKKQDGSFKLREITVDGIKDIKNLAGHHHPVFLLTFTDGTSLVLKSERASDSGARYNATAEIMAQIVDPYAASAVLTPDEREALVKAQARATPYLRELLFQRDTIFVKMKRRTGFLDLQRPGFGQRPFTSFQVGRLHAVVSQLSGAARVWETLGEIVAVDLFLGTADRIAPGGAEGSGAANLQNAGNVFFKFDKSGRLKKALALDNYDTFAGAARIDSAELPHEWLTDYRPILFSEGAAWAFAGTVVDQVVRHAQSAGLQVELGASEQRSFATGFQRSIAKLKAFLRQRPDSLPPGIASRAEALRWL
jgi:hypothetical protein